MRVIIVGSGRVGAGMASQLAEEGHEVVILDIRTQSFRRLAPGFSGQALRGDGTDSSVLERAGAGECEWFLALTNGDNRNILAAQLAKQSVRHPARAVQDQRSGAFAGLRDAGHRHHQPDRDDDRQHRPLHGQARRAGCHRRDRGDRATDTAGGRAGD